MTYMIADVGERILDGVKIPMTDAEKQTIADEWNRNDLIQAERFAARELRLKRAAALQAIEQQQLDAAKLDPNAPQEVKDYAALLSMQNIDPNRP